jgi:hypothetical protein
MNEILFNDEFQSAWCHDTLSVEKTPNKKPKVCRGPSNEHSCTSLALIIFVVSEKKAFEHFPTGSKVNLCPAVAAISDFRSA